MVNVLATGAAVLFVALVLSALVAMANGVLQVAGFSFLSASVVLYLRETRLVE